MKKFTSLQEGYITVEASIVMTIFIFMIFTAMTLLFRIYGNVINYCNSMVSELEVFSYEKHGDVLRIVKVISETGGEIIDEIFNNK